MTFYPKLYNFNVIAQLLLQNGGVVYKWKQCALVAVDTSVTDVQCPRRETSCGNEKPAYSRALQKCPLPSKVMHV